mgnify:CR=1 FL=1
MGYEYNYIYNEKRVFIDTMLILIGSGLGVLLSIITKNYKSKKNTLRWPKYIELIDSLLGVILLIFLILHLPLYRELLTFFLSVNIGFHFTNVF